MRAMRIGGLARKGESAPRRAAESRPAAGPRHAPPRRARKGGSGPERIAGEWWREDSPVRDYYRVEDSAGARFWIYREGLYDEDGACAPAAPRWFLHGVFA